MKLLINVGSPMGEMGANFFIGTPLVYCQELFTEATTSQSMPNILAEFFDSLEALFSCNNACIPGKRTLS